MMMWHVRTYVQAVLKNVWGLCLSQARSVDISVYTSLKFIRKEKQAGCVGSIINYRVS